MIALAAELERSTVILGAKVDEICRSAGIKTFEEVRVQRRPVDPDKLTHALPSGKEITLRRWASAMDAAGWDQRRAEQALEAALKLERR